MIQHYPWNNNFKSKHCQQILNIKEFQQFIIYFKQTIVYVRVALIVFFSFFYERNCTFYNLKRRYKMIINRSTFPSPHVAD